MTLALLDTGRPLIDLEDLLGMSVGQLITPLTRYRNRASKEGRAWAIDNGAYSRFNLRGFLSLLEREEPRSNECLFVACPDVVGCHHRTLDLFEVWAPRVQPFRTAFVLQDGWDGTIPEEASAVFVGGSSEFKDSELAQEAAAEARSLGLWVHVGRLNGPERYVRWRSLMDSFDGSGVARYNHMAKKLARAHSTGQVGFFQ